VKRLLGYLAGIGIGAAAGVVVMKRSGSRPAADGPSPEGAPGSASGADRLKARVARAVEEGRKVMRQTEEKLSKQVAAPGEPTQ
jgi:hypothetical protein